MPLRTDKNLSRVRRDLRPLCEELETKHLLAPSGQVVFAAGGGGTYPPGEGVPLVIENTIDNNIAMTNIVVNFGMYVPIAQSPFRADFPMDTTTVASANSGPIAIYGDEGVWSYPYYTPAVQVQTTFKVHVSVALSDLTNVLLTALITVNPPTMTSFQATADGPSLYGNFQVGLETLTGWQNITNPIEFSGSFNLPYPGTLALIQTVNDYETATLQYPDGGKMTSTCRLPASPISLDNPPWAYPSPLIWSNTVNAGNTSIPEPLPFDSPSFGAVLDNAPLGTLVVSMQQTLNAQSYILYNPGNGGIWTLVARLSWSLANNNGAANPPGGWTQNGVTATGYPVWNQAATDAQQFTQTYTKTFEGGGVDLELMASQPQSFAPGSSPVPIAATPVDPLAPAVTLLPTPLLTNYSAWAVVAAEDPQKNKRG